MALRGLVSNGGDSGMSRPRSVVYVLLTDDEEDDDYGFPKVIHAGAVDVFVLDCRLLEVSGLQDLREEIALAVRARAAAHRLSESDTRAVLPFLDRFLEHPRRLLENTDRAQRWLGAGGGPDGDVD